MYDDYNDDYLDFLEDELNERRDGSADPFSTFSQGSQPQRLAPLFCDGL